MNQDQFLLDSGFWGWLYKLLYPVEWLMTQIMAGFHRFMVMLGMNEIGFSWVMSIVFLVIVVQACVFPLFYKSMKGMRKMQAQMAVLQPKMQRIQNKYKGKNDPASKEALQREMMKLYQDNDANPMGGCTSMLPMFVQGPVFMCMFYTLSAIPYIARGKFRNGSGLGAFDIATAKQFTSTNVFGVNVAENFTTADIHGKIIIGIFVALMCFCLWLMQYNSMKRNMAQSAANKQTEMMQKMMLWMFPIMYIFSGVAMPFAVLVYWLTNNICNLLRSVWQIHVFPTPGSPAAEAKEKPYRALLRFFSYIKREVRAFRAKYEGNMHRTVRWAIREQTLTVIEPYIEDIIRTLMTCGAKPTMDPHTMAIFLAHGLGSCILHEDADWVDEATDDMRRTVNLIMGLSEEESRKMFEDADGKASAPAAMEGEKENEM